MSFEGTVVNGTVVPDEPIGLAEGTRVEFTVKSAKESEPSPTGTTVGQRMMKLAGLIKDMPTDFAAEHDHYIHGTPRRNAQAQE